MSESIPVGFEQKFSNDFMLLSQQKMSRLRGAVRTDATPGAKAFHFDRIGLTTMQRKTSRHMDTPRNDIPHSRRRVSPESWVGSDLIDRADMVRMMKSPQNSYVEALVSAANRQMDTTIIAAAVGNAVSIDADDGATNVGLPAGQQIAAAASGMTLDKWLSAKEILDAAEVDEGERYAVFNAKMLRSLMNTTEIKSADYNSVKALVNGQLDTFLGFNVIRSERLTLDGSNNRLAIFFQKRGLGLYVAEDVVTRVSERADKNYSIQVYVELDIGATRIEDECVVTAACTE